MPSIVQYLKDNKGKILLGGSLAAATIYGLDKYKKNQESDQEIVRQKENIARQKNQEQENKEYIATQEDLKEKTAKIKAERDKQHDESVDDKKRENLRAK